MGDDQIFLNPKLRIGKRASVAMRRVWKDPVPLNEDDPVSRYILQTRKSDDRRASELSRAVKMARAG